MNNYKIPIISILILISVLACDQEIMDTDVVPTDLNVEIMVANNNSGVVTVTATATNALHYFFILMKTPKILPFNQKKVELPIPIVLQESTRLK